jgi:DNA-binding IclR family transcriptional regulator
MCFSLQIGVSKITAAKYLNEMVNDGLLSKHKLGTGNYYVNDKLMRLLTDSTF